MGFRSLNSSLFPGAGGNEKARGALWSPPRLGMFRRFAQGAIGFIVGIRPMCGLPTGPCALARTRVDSEVVPQLSFFGQKKRTQEPPETQTFLVTVL